MTEKDIDIIKNLFYSELQEWVTNIKPILSKGSVNDVYICDTEHWKRLLRINTISYKEGEFEREALCISKAKEAGIKVPEVLTVWMKWETRYMIYDYISWKDWNESDADKVKLRRVLWEYAKKLHSITIEWYWSTIWEPSIRWWDDYVHYNIVSLGEWDELRRLWVLTDEASDVVKNLFSKMLWRNFSTGIIHNDISLKNIIVSDDWECTLIDWWSAEINIVPYMEFIEIIERHLDVNSPNDEELSAFIGWYGLTNDGFNTMQEDLIICSLLNSFDKLRWAIDKNPEQIEEFTLRAKEKLAYSLSLLGVIL